MNNLVRPFIFLVSQKIDALTYSQMDLKTVVGFDFKILEYVTKSVLKSIGVSSSKILFPEWH